MTLTADLTDLVRSKPVDDEDLRIAAGLALDAGANMIAGCASEPGRRLLGWAARTRLLGQDGTWRGDAGRLALLLGGLCHIQEVDDLHRASVVHPGCVVVPVLWGISQTSRHDKPLAGPAALKALLAGFEGACRIGMAVGRGHYAIWHNTATCGPFGAAVAAADLIGLDRAATLDALGNAGTQSAGLWQFLDSGANTKHLHAGRAAEAGLVSAELATEGFTGPHDILEGSRGFFRAMCPDGDPQRILMNPQARWQAHETSIKPWPSCRHTHPSIDSALSLAIELAASGTDPQAIERVEVAAYDAALALCDRPAPLTTYHAKFSLQHCVAAALTDGEVTFGSFEPETIARLAPLCARVSVKSDPRFEQAYPKSWGSALEVKLTDGRTLSAERRAARGDPDLPLSDAELVAKAKTLMRYGGFERSDSFVSALLETATGGPWPAFPLDVLSASIPRRAPGSAEAAE